MKHLLLKATDATGDKCQLSPYYLPKPGILTSDKESEIVSECKSENLTDLAQIYLRHNESLHKGISATLELLLRQH